MGNFFGRETLPPPPAGCIDRWKNILVVHFRGIFGFLVPLIVFAAFYKKNDALRVVKLVWFTMLWYYALQPVSVPVTGFIPVFVFPFTGTLDSTSVCKALFNESMVLYLVGGMIVMLLNVCNIHRRITCSILRSEENSSYKPQKLLFKTSVAAFITSMISHRLISSGTLVDIVQPAMASGITFTEGKMSEPVYSTVQYPIYNGIVSSSCIGSIVIMHATYHVLFVRGVFDHYARPATRRKRGTEYIFLHNYPIEDSTEEIIDNISKYEDSMVSDDIVDSTTFRDGLNASVAQENKTTTEVEPLVVAEAPAAVEAAVAEAPMAVETPVYQRRQDDAEKVDVEVLHFTPYTTFALPLAFFLFIANYIYNSLQISRVSEGRNSPYTLSTLKNAIHREDYPLPRKFRPHEKECIFAFVVILIALFTRKGLSPSIDWKLGGTREGSVICAAMVILQLLPKSLKFFKTLSCTTKSQLRKQKPESAWLFWRYCNKNTIYGYIFVMGSGWIMISAAKLSTFDVWVASKLEPIFSSYEGALFFCVFVTGLLANILPPITVLTHFVPLWYFAAEHSTNATTKSKVLYLVLGAAIATTFSFMFPFRHLPYHYLRKRAKLRVSQMVLFGWGSVVICCLVTAVYIWLMGEFFYTLFSKPAAAAAPTP